MKNVIKFVAATAVMSTAAFAEVSTSWTGASVDVSTIVSGASTSTAFNDAAGVLEGYLEGATITELTGTPTIVNGKIVIETTTSTVYSKPSIVAEINNVKAALATDVYGDADGIELDGSDSGILGVVANEFVDDLETLVDNVATFKTDYATGDAGSAELATLISEIDAVVATKDAFNAGVDAYDVIVADLVAQDTYE